MTESADPIRDESGLSTETQSPEVAGGRTKQDEAPQMPTGWRTSRRSTRAGKKARKDVKSKTRRIMLATGVERVTGRARRFAYLTGMAVTAVSVVLLALVLVATVVNGVARWAAQRGLEASSDGSGEEGDRNNLLLIAAEEGTAVGFLVIRNDEQQAMAYAIAIPEAAFIEVPGQGFERIGDSFAAGPEVSAAAISNFLGVPFSKWGVIDGATYQASVSSQSLGGVIETVGETNMDESERTRWAQTLSSVPTEDVAIVPLPTKPVNVGSQTYLDPQREEIADLMERWWGVSSADAEEVVRVIVYNGAGVPGIAGEAGQVLIRKGFRVVDTKNADNFGYQKTKVVVQNGDENDGVAVRDALGVGEIVMQPADQQIADVIVIIGKDYEPPAKS